MTDDEIKDTIKAMQSIAIDGILYAHCFNIAKNTKVWNDDEEKALLIRFLKRSFADNAVICWTKIFGSDGSEKTHWKTLYKNKATDGDAIIIEKIPSNYNYSTAGSFRERVYKKDNFQKAAGKEEYHENAKAMRNNIKNYRDSYLAHANILEVNTGRITSPYIFPIYKTLTEFSDILIDIDKVAGFNLFPVNGYNQEYSIQRDNLKNSMASNIQKILNKDNN